jgi:arginyl-tRNA synthetase
MHTISPHKEEIAKSIVACIHQQWQIDINEKELHLEITREEFVGDITLVVFPLVKILRKSPDYIGETIGTYLIENLDFLENFNLIKGFLNLKLKNSFWLNFLNEYIASTQFGRLSKKEERILVEFCSPNTNKPLHLGHIRNILIGDSISKILDFCGYDVKKVQIINDRGIAICKSMLAWKLYGENKTPDSVAMKGDHFVGYYYVLFENKFKEEYKEWQTTNVAQKLFTDKGRENQSKERFFLDFKNDYFNTYSTLGNQVKNMLLEWEEGKEDTRNLWDKMNQWVYQGFDKTYESLGVSFDKLYYESNTYLLGKKWILDGLEKQLFIQKDDGSVWVDLKDSGWDEKILLRNDGTSVYITQDIGTVFEREKDFSPTKMIYVVADEQNYHFEVLFKTLEKLQYAKSSQLYHLSYGMVELPSGRMKSREGTVVDADDLIAEVIEEASSSSMQKDSNFFSSIEEKHLLDQMVGLGALKYYILKVHPKKKMIFNPVESLDLQGNTGPYIQNAYVRIRSILRKSGNFTAVNTPTQISDQEVDLIKSMSYFQSVVLEAAQQLDPSLLSSFSYTLAKKFHKYYHDTAILATKEDELRNFRLYLIHNLSTVLEKSMNLLGIQMPEKM